MLPQLDLWHCGRKVCLRLNLGYRLWSSQHSGELSHQGFDHSEDSPEFLFQSQVGLCSGVGICEERAEAEGVAPTLSGGGKNFYFPIFKLTIGSTFVNRWKA